MLVAISKKLLCMLVVYDKPREVSCLPTFPAGLTFNRTVHFSSLTMDEVTVVPQLKHVTGFFWVWISFPLMALCEYFPSLYICSPDIAAPPFTALSICMPWVSKVRKSHDFNISSSRRGLSLLTVYTQWCYNQQGCETFSRFFYGVRNFFLKILWGAKLFPTFSIPNIFFIHFLYFEYVLSNITLTLRISLLCTLYR